MRLSAWGAACLPAYLAISLVIGWLSRPRGVPNANSFLNASRAMPLPLVIAAFLAANCGALEVIGLSAMAAQYGALAFHFYWIGAIPAMVVLGLYVMPAYRASEVHSVPQFLKVRFGQRLATLNEVAIACAMLMLNGISLYAMAQVLRVVLQLSFLHGVLLSALVVLLYVSIGGVRATIYTEAFQLVVMLAGLLPLGLRSAALLRHPSPAASEGLDHAWAGLHLVDPSAPMDGLGLVFGLGLVLSFGYWCSDFVLMQRAFAARTTKQARAVPLWAGLGKLLFGLLVVLPGLALARAPALAHTGHYDQSLPAMMGRLYGPTLLGLGLTALAASLMSGMAANVSGFAAVWTEDLYRRLLRPNQSEGHYLRVGRAATLAAVGIGMCCSTLSFRFNNLMEHVQLIFALLNAPFWAVFLMGVATRRVRENAAIAGFLCGVAVGAAHTLTVHAGWLHYGSRMSCNFYSAIFAFTGATLMSFAVSRRTPQPAHSQPLLVRGQQGQLRAGWLWALAGLLLAACAWLNCRWW